MALSRTKSRLTISAPPPSPIPTGTGSRSAGNETFQRFLDNTIYLPQLSLPGTRFVSGANPSPAAVDFELLNSSDGGHAAALMLRSAIEYGAFRIVNHGISGEEILSAVNEAECGLGDCDEGFCDRRWVEEVGNRAAILQVRRRSDSAPAETYRDFSEKMEKIASKLEGIGEKLSEILLESMEKKWDENNMKKREKDNIFRIYKYNHQNEIGKKREEKESENVMLNLHIPVEHCQFFVSNGPHQQAHSFCFDVAAHSIVVTIGKRLEEWSMGKLKSARSDEIIFVPNLDGSQTFSSIELKFSNPNLPNYPSHSNIISISDQIYIAFILLSLYFLYTYLLSLKENNHINKIPLYDFYFCAKFLGEE